MRSMVVESIALDDLLNQDGFLLNNDCLLLGTNWVVFLNVAAVLAVVAQVILSLGIVPSSRPQSHPVLVVIAAWFLSMLLESSLAVASASGESLGLKILLVDAGADAALWVISHDNGLFGLVLGGGDVSDHSVHSVELSVAAASASAFLPHCSEVGDHRVGILKHLSIGNLFECLLFKSSGDHNFVLEGASALAALLRDALQGDWNFLDRPDLGLEEVVIAQEFLFGTIVLVVPVLGEVGPIFVEVFGIFVL